jgi:hypothetical protein
MVHLQPMRKTFTAEQLAWLHEQCFDFMESQRILYLTLMFDLLVPFGKG